MEHLQRYRYNEPAQSKKKQPHGRDMQGDYTTPVSKARMGVFSGMSQHWKVPKNRVVYHHFCCYKIVISITPPSDFGP